MASYNQPEEIRKGVEDLEKEITCPVCHDHFQEPKILPCCHVYCKGCVQKLARRAGANQPFACPECRSNTLLPQNDPNQLPTVPFFNRLIELHSRMEKAHGKAEALCELCAGNRATAFCYQCAEFICDDCTKDHHRMKMFAGHKVATLDKLKEGGAKIPVKQAPPPTCKTHDAEEMKIYCYECKHLICRDCVIDDHAGHKYEFVKSIASEIKQKLAERLVPLKKIQRNLGKGNEMASNVIQRLVDFVEQNIENATEEELMDVHTQLLNRIDEETKKHQQSSVPTSTSLELHDPYSPGAHKIIQPVLSSYTGLSGADVYATTTVVIRNSSLEWCWDKFGLKVHVHNDSLPPDIKECHISINVSLSGHYEFPEDESLVSAVFWFRCVPPCKLAKPVTVEIQHCAPSDNVSNLSFVKAVCTQKELPYTFKHLPGGSFCKHSSFGIIELTSFSGLGITQKGSKERDYLATLLYKEEQFYGGLCFHLYFVVTWNTVTHYMVMKKFFDETKFYTNQRVVFESDRVEFRFSYAPGENWTIICINSDVVEREAIDNFTPGKTSWIPYSQFKAKLSRVMTGGAPALHCEVDLHGAKGPQNKFTIDINPSLVADVLPYARQEQARIAPYSVRAKPTLKELMRELRCKAACWEDIGVELQIDDGVLAQIQRDKNGISIDCLREMFRKWLVQVSPTPSWSAIVEAVNTLGDEELVRSIKTRYT